MRWSERYKSGETPSLEQISEYVNSPFWAELCNFIQENYKTQPKVEYSCCSLQPGWNVKYKKSSKSICTLYPNEDFFTCMVTVAGKSMMEAEYLLPSLDEYIQNIFNKTTVFNGSKWLMLDVTNEKILKDIKALIKLKMK